MNKEIRVRVPHVIFDVMHERRRQIEVEGFTPEHDGTHCDRSLARAAICYVDQYASLAWLLDGEDNGEKIYAEEPVPNDWPASWAEKWWKPKSPRCDLVRAVALLIAEIERLDRAEALKLGAGETVAEVAP